MLKDGKVPKNAKKEISGGMFAKGHYEITVYTPRGRAASFAETAKENYIKLDSANYSPELFNGPIKVVVENILADAGHAEFLRHISRVIILRGEDVFEADSTELIETTYGNAYGAEYANTDAIVYFDPSLFDGSDDLKFIIFDNHGKCERKLKKKDAKKLE